MKLEVRKEKGGAGVVDLDLRGAVLSEVVKRILNQSDYDFIVRTPLPPARVTARFAFFSRATRHR